MGNLLIDVVFHLVEFLYNIFALPFINVILTLFPSLDEPFGHILNFLTEASVYLACILRWLLFTPAMFVLLFGYFMSKFTIWLTSSVVRTGFKMYNLLKP